MWEMVLEVKTVYKLCERPTLSITTADTSKSPFSLRRRG
jgi:hypothetical protein